MAKWPCAGLVLAGMFLAGYFAAIITTREELLIDFKSGELRRRLLVGPIVLKDARPRHMAFQELGSPSGNSGTLGKPDWRKALVPWGISLRSSYSDGGMVLNETARLGKWFPVLSRHDAARVKQGFLAELSKGGVDKAVAYSKDMEDYLYWLIKNQQANRDKTALRVNGYRIKAGMSYRDIVAVLGKPNHIHRGDNEKPPKKFVVLSYRGKPDAMREYCLYFRNGLDGPLTHVSCIVFH